MNNIIDLSSKKVLIFSDTHLTCKFDEKKFHALKLAIEKSDFVIINGDFWEYIVCDFKNFISSKWSEKLFYLLKSKNTFYIHGNHDHERHCFWDGIKLFADNHEKDFSFKSGNKIFKVEHGDLVSLEFDEYHRVITKIFEKFLPSFYIFLISFETKKGVLAKIWKKIMLLRRKKDFKNLEKFAKKNFRENHINIFGHVHMKKHDLKDNFVVLGEFMNGHRNYVYIKNGEIEFVSGKY